MNPETICSVQRDLHILKFAELHKISAKNKQQTVFSEKRYALNDRLNNDFNDGFSNIGLMHISASPVLIKKVVS
ncbi:hypothetical protein CDG61_08455 [Acinetobacter sp. WCHAc010052]|jgi:hypothetical protein|nr:hypothetical protein CDG61_08455 [Acinetobacter sp. WCHAc010052]